MKGGKTHLNLKRNLDRMERNYKLSDVKNVQVIDMLKEKNISRCYKDKTI